MKNWQHRRRLFIVCGFFIVILIILIWRMLDLTVLNRQFLKHQGDARSIRVVNIPAYRGMITDRLGISLAVSTPMQSAWIDPRHFVATSKQLELLSLALNMPLKSLQKKIRVAHGRGFVYLKRQFSPEIAEKIAQLKIVGLYLQQEFKRYYPESNSTAQLLGFTNIDDSGIEGLELAYQDWLEGVPGKKKVLKDRAGHIVEDLGVICPPKPGKDLVLSVDRRIQYLAYHELMRTLEKFSAQSGSVVVLDTKSGEILAVANAPSFNPNDRTKYTQEYYRNKAFTDVFEPGSVFKPFSIASALECKQVTPDTIVDTRPGSMVVHGRVIRDIHNYGVLDVTGILQHSSNVGVTKITLLSPPEQLIGLSQRFGFGQGTASSYPGESEGTMIKAKQANPFVLATLGFGYGVSVTAAQLAKAYMVFANHGYKKSITFVHSYRMKAQEKVLDPTISDQVLLMMEAVLGNEGTGKQARVVGYRVAGKTGTSRIAGRRGYEANRHIASFVGIAPVSDPRLVVVVVVYEPTKNGYYGAAVAAPLFAKVMSGALRILEVPPDKIIG